MTNILNNIGYDEEPILSSSVKLDIIKRVIESINLYLKTFERGELEFFSFTSTRSLSLLPTNQPSLKMRRC